MPSSNQWLTFTSPSERNLLRTNFSSYLVQLLKAPLMIYILPHPSHLVQRSEQISVFMFQLQIAISYSEFYSNYLLLHKKSISFKLIGNTCNRFLRYQSLLFTFLNSMRLSDKHINYILWWPFRNSFYCIIIFSSIYNLPANWTPIGNPNFLVLHTPSFIFTLI